MIPEQQHVDEDVLTEYLIDEINKLLRITKEGKLTKVIEPLYKPAAHRLAQLGARFDNYVAERGFCSAARWVLPNFVRRVIDRGVQNVPLEGPLLITSNHPGTFDSLVIAATLPRLDLKIVASGRPFFRGLPATARHLIYTSPDAYERMTVIRSAIRHLQEGGTLLIFPSGKVDPDPDVLPGAGEALERWSPSLDVIMRRVPQAQVLVTIVSGVLSKEWVRHPLTYMRKEIHDRQMVAEFFQVIQQMLFPHSLLLTPKITFSEPFTSSEMIINRQSGRLQNLIENAKKTLSLHAQMR